MYILNKLVRIVSIICLIPFLAIPILFLSGNIQATGPGIGVLINGTYYLDIGSLISANPTFESVNIGTAVQLIEVDDGLGGKQLQVNKTIAQIRVAGQPSSVRLYEIPSNGDNYLDAKAPDSIAANYSGTMSVTVASGTAAMGTGAIASGSCASTVTVNVNGILTTDVVDWGFNSDPTSTTGYSASANGMLTIVAYPTADNANFKVCNNTSASVTPGAITLNWRVRR